MPKAYILINCESGYESPVVKSIKSIDCVLTCSIVYGVYDILVEIIFDNLIRENFSFLGLYLYIYRFYLRYFLFNCTRKVSLDRSSHN